MAFNKKNLVACLDCKRIDRLERNNTMKTIGFRCCGVAACIMATLPVVAVRPQTVSAPGHGVQISELELFEDGKNLRGEIVRAFADEQVKTTAGKMYHETTVPAMAFDGDVKTKWFDFRASTSQASEVRAAAWVAAEFKRPVKITGYAWSTANDYNERDPSSWRLQGSNDGKTWTDIHVVRGYFATGTRNARAYEFAGHH